MKIVILYLSCAPWWRCDIRLSASGRKARRQNEQIRFPVSKLWLVT